MATTPPRALRKMRHNNTLARPSASVCARCGDAWPCAWASNGKPWDKHRPLAVAGQKDAPA